MNPICAAFVAEYTLMPPMPRRPAIDDIAMMCPRRWRRNTGSAAAAAYIVPMRLTSTSRRITSGGVSSSAP